MIEGLYFIHHDNIYSCTMHSCGTSRLI